jgi:hypothetical protein
MSRPSSRFRSVCRWGKECILEYLPGAKPTWEFIRREGRGVKEGRALFGVMAICLVVVTIWVTHKFDTRSQTEITINEKDPKARADFESLQPLKQEIAAVRFTVIIDFKSPKEGHVRDLDSGMAIILVVPSGKKDEDRGILWGTTFEHVSNGQGESRFVIDAPFDTYSMGKTVSSLADVDKIVMHFKEQFMPVGADIEGGQVVMVVNNQITVNFKIPPQVVSQRLDSEKTAIMLKNVKKEMRQVIKPPS